MGRDDNGGEAAASSGLAAFLARRTTLYLDCGSGEVALRGNQLLLGQDRRLALSQIRRIVLIGRANAACALLYECMKAGIAVDWLDWFGHPLGQLLPLGQAGHCCLASQDAFCASPAALALARQLILAKVDNCHEVLRRRWPGHPLQPGLRRRLAQAQNMASLRGHEGHAAREYFSAWPALLPGLAWEGRQARPAPDPANMLLSTGYGFLRNRLASALSHAGLNPRQGFFHEGRGRHQALASDLMEPLRALVDARVLTMLRRRELRPQAFQLRGGRCVCASRDAFGLILREFEEMFASCHKFYTDPQDNSVTVERSLNDLLDDLAESYALHVHDGQGCLVPRLAPCAAV